MAGKRRESKQKSSATRAPRIAIIGLGTDARALALALQRVKTDYELVGHDREAERARTALADGLVDRNEWNLFDAVEPADLVVLAEPLDQLLITLEQIAPHLRPGALVTDLAALKAPVLELATRVLPDEVSFVGGHLLIDRARVQRAEQSRGAGKGGKRDGKRAGKREGADSDSPVDAPTGTAPLHGATWCLSPAPNATDDAVRVLGRLVRAVGAEALFIDAKEHDALVAGVSLLPRLTAAAQLRLIAASPSADDLRRLADPTLRVLLDDDDWRSPEDLATGSATRSALLHWLDGLETELARLRSALLDEGDDALTDLAAETTEAFAGWLAPPEPGEQSAILDDLSPKNVMRRMLFGGRRREDSAPRPEERRAGERGAEDEGEGSGADA